jgi:peptidoglycan/xylan/chitin deacetylase (PgdA/CDA1 family)
MLVATILTYHRIVPDGSREQFHDIEATAFVRQLRRVLERTVTEGRAGSRPACGPVCLTFDDGTADHRRAADLVSAHGLTGTFFVITGRLGSPGYLSEGDVRSIAAQGHRIASHSVTHRHLTLLNAAELTEELVASRERLEALGQRTVDWFASPGGVYSRAILDRVLQSGYQIVRTMDWGYAELPLRGQVPCLPVIARYDMAMFDRLLEGRAPLWLHSVKNLLKRSFGLGVYIKLRTIGDKVTSR